MTDKFIGPVLPANFSKYKETEENESSGGYESTSAGSYGPTLPPHLKTKNEDIHSGTDYSDDYDTIGPVMPGSSDSATVVQEALEERAQMLKYEFLLGKFDNSTEQPKRESWMTELPPEKAEQFGLGPRKFKKSYSDSSRSNRSAWTETPADKKKKNNEIAENVVTDADLFEAASVRTRNETMDEIVEKTKSKKGKKSLSLLELHQKKLKKKKKKKNKKDEKPERRPFDREIDLHVNRFDEAQKKSIIKKAQQLDTRFSAGKSKYL